MGSNRPCPGNNTCCNRDELSRTLCPCDELAQLRAENAALRADLERVWPTPIPCAERLPEQDVYILLWHQGRWHHGYYRVWHGDREFVFKGYCLNPLHVSHWIPLPPPVGGEK